MPDARVAGGARMRPRRPTTTLRPGSLIQTTTQNDGRAIINAGRRLVEFPFRH